MPRKVEPLNIDALLGKPMNMVARVAVELEGAWSQVPEGIEWEGDASVFKGSNVRNIYQCGEIPSGAMQPGGLNKFIRKYYPEKIDDTCGFHIHMSFKTLLRYTLLMEEAYQETIIEYLSRWAKEEGFPKDHCIWDRLAGKSIFSQKAFWPDLQVAQVGKDYDKKRKGHRYTIVNYCGRLNTIEIRVLPMMDTSDQAIRAVRRVLDITNASLTLLSKDRRIKTVGKIELPGGLSYEEASGKDIPLTSAQRRLLRGVK